MLREEEQTGADHDSVDATMLSAWAQAKVSLDASLDRYLDASLAVKHWRPNHKNSALLSESASQVDKELGQIRSRLTKLRQAQTIMATLRNRFPTLVPMSILPSEVLAHIFHILVLQQFYVSVHNKGYARDTPLYPESLSAVCKHWQDVVNNTPLLWSYIDVLVQGAHTDRFYWRATLAVQRSGHAPLFIRLRELVRFEASEGGVDIQRLNQWMHPIAQRIHSLEAGGLSNISAVYFVLDCLLQHGDPHVFKSLSLWLKHCSQNQFMKPAADPKAAHFQFNVSPERFEAIFGGITLLRVGHILPLWHSQAYRGLAHLSMSAESIPEEQLITILSNNPHLCTLSLNTRIVQTNSRKFSPVAISLPRLATLGIGPSGVDGICAVLRLLAPGSWPLKLGIALEREIDLYDVTEAIEVQQFLQRSNVIALYVTASLTGRHIGNISLCRALERFPNLRKLCLEYIYYDDEGMQTDASDPSQPRLQLSELCMIACEIDVKTLTRFLSSCFVGVLRLLDCHVVIGSSRGLREDDLRMFAPNVKCYESDKYGDRIVDPYLNWDFAYF